MTLDPQVAAYLDQLRELEPPAPWEVPIDEARRPFDEAAVVLFGPPDPVHAVEDADAGGVPVRLYRPRPGDLPALVFYHGGGWVLGGLESHDRLCRALAARAGCTVVAVDYRLAPEHPYPAAIEDAWTATCWAADRFPRVAVGGDSAGGQLAAAVARRARDAGRPVALQVLIYPVTDHDADTPSARECTEGPAFTTAQMRWFWDQYLPDAAPASDPDCSPLRTPDLAGLAPALVLTAEYDPLRDEGEDYARRLEAAGVPVTLSRYDGLIHGFIRMPAVIDRAGDAIDEVSAAVAAALGA